MDDESSSSSESALLDEDDQQHDNMIKAYSNELLATLRDVLRLNPLFNEHVQYFSQRFDLKDPYRLTDMACALSTAGTPEELQSVLEASQLEERMKQVLVLLRREREVTELQQQIRTRVEEQISEQQRKYFLQEQMKMIQQELGIAKDDKEALLQKFQTRLDTLRGDEDGGGDDSDDDDATSSSDPSSSSPTGAAGPGGACIPDEVQTVINEEMGKLQTLEKNSSEFNVTRNYLEWLTQLPWGHCKDENFDVIRAREILNEDHYGLQDVKDRILEFIAVGCLRGSVQGKIICLSGPPGVGKTSIGKSIARALNREFYRFSVGGLTDVAEIKGHRRTYVGAMPGKLVQALKATGTSNPLVLIDEVDKIGTGHRGDPSSALLELLDPGQNETFMDLFLDVPIDLSKVLFVCTANETSSIPGPLLDRMEVIQLSGYDLTEKVEIAKQYLEPKVREAAGLAPGGKHTPTSLEIDENALKALARWWCRESGVRNLEQHMERIFRKAALEVVTSSKDSKDWAITESALEHYVGKPVFTSDRLYDEPPEGVIAGLAWTSMGGSVLYIETKLVGKRTSKQSFDDLDLDGAIAASECHDVPSLTTTGKLGEVMQESSRIAAVVAGAKLRAYDPSCDYFDSANIHLHVPAGAVPKDGPSAGVTMATAMISLALNRPARADMAMTGELTLTGRVMPVGGIREKIIAARRAGLSCIVIPKENARDFAELPDYLREDLEIHYAETYDDVFDVAFCEDRFFDF